MSASAATTKCETDQPASHTSLRKLKNRQHAANSRLKKAQHLKKLSSKADALTKDVQQLRERLASETAAIAQERRMARIQPCISLGSPLPADLSRTRVSSLSSLGVAGALEDGNNSDFFEADIDSLWEDIGGMTLAAPVVDICPDAASLQPTTHIVDGTNIKELFEDEPFCFSDLEVDSTAGHAPLTPRAVSDEPTTPLTSFALSNSASMRTVLLERMSSFEFEDDSSYTDTGLKDGNAPGMPVIEPVDSSYRTAKTRRPSSCSTGSSGSAGSSGSGTSMTTCTSIGADSDDGSSVSDSGSSGSSVRSQRSAPSKPKAKVPEVIRTDCVDTARKRLEAYFSAEAWGEMRQQLKLCDSILGSEEVARWKRKRSKGMKLARNRRYGSRRRARERKETAALENFVKNLEKDKHELLTKLKELQQPRVHRFGQSCQSATGLTQANTRQKRPAPMPSTLLENTNHRIKYKSPHNCGSARPCSGVIANLPPLKLSRMESPVAFVSEPVASEWDAGLGYGGTAFRLFAVVAVAVVATSLDSGSAANDNSNTTMAGPGTVGRVLSACYLLNTRQIVDLIEAFPLCAVAVVVASCAMALGLSLAAGSHERMGRAASIFKKQQRPPSAVIAGSGRPGLSAAN